MLLGASLAVVALPAAAQAAGFRAVRVTGGLNFPVAVTAPKGSKQVFVVEKGGKIRIVRNGAVLPKPFLNVSSLVSNGVEQGLLGLAFHPNYARNGRFFVNYTNTNGDTRVVEYRRSAGDVNAANPGSARVVLSVAQPYANHNGGNLVFGPDGMLYIGLGDGGGGGDPEGRAQRLDTLLGKMLRIDVDRGSPYGIPPGNPFVGRAGARPEIWQYGLRNPWRYSFDRVTGDLWIGDVGQEKYEEIDRTLKGRGGQNFGWNAREGREAYPGGGPLNGNSLGPVAAYSHDSGCSVTGGFVYRGAAVPALRGRYVYADYCSGRFWTLLAGRRTGNPVEITGQLGARIANPTTFGEGGTGELYVAGNDALYRFAPR